MYTRIRRGIKNGAYNYCEFVADAESDISKLPTTSSSGRSGDDVYEPCCAGSKVYVTDLRKSYILSNGDEWKIFVNYAYQGGGSSASIESEDDGDGNVSII